MRFFLVLLVIWMVFAPLASAKPVTMREAAAELRKRGATQLDGVVLSGTPVIKGSINEQGFNASMRQCDRPEFACRVVIFRACKQVAGTTSEEALQLANAYNTQTEPRGYMLISGQSGAPSLCVQARYDLTGSNEFDQGETFGWQQTISNYQDFLEEDARARLSRSVLE